MGWFSRKPKLREVKVTLTAPEEALIEWWAVRTDTPVDELVNLAIKGLVPLEERIRYSQHAETRDVVEHALDLLDGEGNDLELGDGVFPVDPPTPNVAEDLPEDDDELPEDPELLHACRYLARGVQRGLGLKTGDACGSCWHRSQRGKPCHWPSAAARHCPVFNPKETNRSLKGL